TIGGENQTLINPHAFGSQQRLIMIGIIAVDAEKESAMEFFELFKTPWEFYAPGRNYDVIISTLNNVPKVGQRLTILCSSERDQFRNNEEIQIQSTLKSVTLKYADTEIPIYGNLLTFTGKGQPILEVMGEVAGLKINEVFNQKVLLGFNLFEEIHHLLSVGQPKENALIPTIDVHISLIRNLIVEAGIPLIEIPPMPPGYDFMTCLTHDIDFAGIRKHKLDHTMFGFVYRASIGSLARCFKGRLPLRKLLRNWSAVLRLPFVYLGVAKDFWLQVNSYVEIEKNLKSTFFFVPFKHKHGDHILGNGSRKRATKYDISDVEEIAKALRDNGFEIGIHGIDAWHDLEKALQERSRITEYLKGKEIGVRIHWLLFDSNSYRVLDEAGFSYDSTLGFNEAIGYRAGTLQVFKPFGVKRLLELPLHIQDTALFYPKRMDLSDTEALALCEKLIHNAKSYNGVLTILWHDRSLGPERLWKEFYINLLGKIRENKVFFSTASEIVNWFRKRRAVKFKEIKVDQDKISLFLDYVGNDDHSEKGPSLFIRVYYPKFQVSNNQNPSFIGSDHKDIILGNQRFLEIPLKAFNSQPEACS
ncbi:MAG TPA: hypothetical protein DCY12_01895, partial [Candidatus Atribacteria bacterium]|nr:hypothetical protein [Candidatus Atribacteria bacterium]